jgi:putative ABC transport system substrate-binding protein
VAAGLAASLGRPGGSVTGLSAIGTELTAKRLELLAEALPGRKRVAVLYRSGVMAAESQLEALRALANAKALQLIPVEVGSEEALPAAIDTVSRSADALLVLPSPFAFTHRKRIVSLVREKGVPAMYGESVFVTEGGLMAYSVDFHHQFRRAAAYVHRILKGAKPAELPIEEPTKFELVVNLRTARDMQLKLPPTLLLRADRVIE